MKRIEDFRNLPVTSILRLFHVHEDFDKTRFVNVFRSYAISAAAQTNSFMFEYYTVEQYEFLDDISSRFYGTPTLWWVVAAFNEELNPYEALDEGVAIKVLRQDYLYSIFDDIQSIGEL